MHGHPLARRTIRAVASRRAGQRRESSSAPLSQRSAPRAARGSPAPADTRHRHALIGQRRRPRPPGRRDSGGGSARRPPIAAADWAEAAVSHIEGRASRRPRPRLPAPIDIIGARRGRPGCSRGWRAAGPVRELGSGAEAEEKEAKEKGSLEGGSAEPQTSAANSPPSSSTHQAAAVAVSRNRELEI